MNEWIGREVSNVKIEKFLAQGGMGEVYLGWHQEQNRQVAVKVIHAKMRDDPQLMSRFQKEAQALTAMDHPHIVHCLDCNVFDGRPYFIMELLEGRSLEDYMRGLNNQGYLLPLHVIVQLTQKIAAALDYAHKSGFVHMDIKPANIMLESKIVPVDPNPPIAVPPDLQPIVTDFGLARMARALHDDSDGVFMGTPAYMSPEQIRGKMPDPRSDIYALGVVLYELLAGQLPFDTKTNDLKSLLEKQLREAPPRMANIDPKVEAVVRKALEKNPRKRFKTVSAFAKRLAAAAKQH